MLISFVFFTRLNDVTEFFLLASFSKVSFTSYSSITVRFSSSILMLRNFFMKRSTQAVTLTR